MSDYDHWLTGHGSRYELGGRATDLSQIGYSLQHAVKAHYPINGVPADVLERLNHIVMRLEVVHCELDEFFDFMEEKTR
jgi:hypothetical protein